MSRSFSTAFLAKTTFSQNATDAIRKSVGVGPVPVLATDSGSSWIKVNPRTIPSDFLLPISLAVALLVAIASVSCALRSWIRFVKIVFTIDGTIDMIFSTEEKRMLSFLRGSLRIACQSSTVDRDGGASDEGCLVTAKPCREKRNLFRRADSTHRDGLLDL